jgi:hypothetical protein
MCRCRQPTGKSVSASGVGIQTVSVSCVVRISVECNSVLNIFQTW